MKIFRYMVKRNGYVFANGNRQETATYGVSNQSVEDAELNAQRNLEIIQDRINRNERFSPAEDYEATIREEFLEEIAPGNVTTRNYYGAEILNTESLIFADIDNSDFKKRYVPGFIGRLFGKKAETQEEYQARLRNSVLNAVNPEWKEKAHIRVYQTHSGFRVLFSGLNLPANSKACAGILKQMNSDPLYICLCKKQGCCRARLTPKPTRIRQRIMRLKYPYAPEDLSVISEWVQAYQERSRKYAVCKLIQTYGKDPLPADMEVVAYHDQKCKVGLDLPLA